MKKFLALTLAAGVAAQPAPLDNCITVVPNAFNFHWSVMTDTIMIRMESAVPDDNYVAWSNLGTPAAIGGARMVGGDAQMSVVSNNVPVVIDGFMRNPTRCDPATGSGVCPDGTNMTANGMQSNINMTGWFADGVRNIQFVRPLIASDMEDADVDTTDNAMFMFAAGPIVDGLPNVHTNRAVVALSLMRTPAIECSPLVMETGTNPDITTPMPNTINPDNTPEPTDANGAAAQNTLVASLLTGVAALLL